jgi:hypothetical protein
LSVTIFHTGLLLSVEQNILKCRSDRGLTRIFRRFGEPGPAAAAEAFGRDASHCSQSAGGAGELAAIALGCDDVAGIVGAGDE